VGIQGHPDKGGDGNREEDGPEVRPPGQEGAHRQRKPRCGQGDLIGGDTGGREMAHQGAQQRLEAGFDVVERGHGSGVVITDEVEENRSGEAQRINAIHDAAVALDHGAEILHAPVALDG